MLHSSLLHPSSSSKPSSIQLPHSYEWTNLPGYIILYLNNLRRAQTSIAFNNAEAFDQLIKTFKVPHIFYREVRFGTVYLIIPSSSSLKNRFNLDPHHGFDEIIKFLAKNSGSENIKTLEIESMDLSSLQNQDWIMCSDLTFEFLQRQSEINLSLRIVLNRLRDLKHHHQFRLAVLGDLEGEILPHSRSIHSPKPIIKAETIRFAEIWDEGQFIISIDWFFFLFLR